LAINLKSVLKDGITDENIEIKVDKTVVFINLSDKMLYQSGSSNLTPRTYKILAKIAQYKMRETEAEVNPKKKRQEPPLLNYWKIDWIDNFTVFSSF